jgi:glucosamine 6-phosphate synthetase-like amidotransferase/phosphosugar isomerase protein
VISAAESLSKLMDVKEIPYLIDLQSCKSLFAALQACTALQMISYFTSRAKGLNPDQQVFDAIDFNHAFQ